MNSHPLLEVRLYLINGSTHKFIQNDPDLVHRTLCQINRRVFGQPSLVIYGDNSAAVYQGSALVGISIIIDPIPAELLMLDQSADDVLEISEKEYHKRLTALADAHGANRTGEFVTEIELSTGRRLWLESRPRRPAGVIDERNNVHHAFTLPSLVCRCNTRTQLAPLSGPQPGQPHGLSGLSIWNRFHMVSMTFSPRPEVPFAAWVAERDEEMQPLASLSGV